VRTTIVEPRQLVSEWGRGAAPRIVGYATGTPLMVADYCSHEVCQRWSTGPCTVNLAFLSPPEVGEGQ